MRKYKINILLVVIVVMNSCNNGGRGYEYMPNMYRSPSLETYGSNKIFSDSLNARTPVEGTIARGYLSSFNYEKTLEGYLFAGENAKNPFNEEKEIEEGKVLYGMFCKHCHGKNGTGGGTITHPLYSAVPAYNESDPTKIRRSGSTMSELKAGHIFHAITYGIEGKAMGPHASQLTEEERWKIVLYVQELQQYSKE